MELDMLDEPATTITMANKDTPKRTDISAWALRLDDPSPVSTVMSITPRAGGGRARESISPTPTPFSDSGFDDTDANDSRGFYNGDSNLDNDNDNEYEYDDAEWPNDQGWGDDAMMEWDATSTRDDDVSSVDREEAGLSDDDWGRDALLAWDDDDDNDNDNDNDKHDEQQDHDYEIRNDVVDVSDDDTEHVESEDNLHARGMPTYRDWAIKDLQVIAYIFTMAC